MGPFIKTLFGDARNVAVVAGIVALEFALVRLGFGREAALVVPAAADTGAGHVRAARAADSSYAYAYTPLGRPVTVRLDALRGPFGSAAMALYGTRLHWQAQGTYQLLNESIARQWDYEEDRDPQSTDALRRDMALDPALRVVVAHGLYDLVTPYFASKLLLDQVPARVAGDRLRLIAVPGGHMMYTEDASRAALRDAARWAASGVPETETSDPPAPH